ncbi:MAG: XRE family transcriptional regulator [Clostridia bacterium]|nr:XRE family transcriptional regulator [Clostridia bacterium]NCC68379.1 XRE family transcriptional regulator [Clostridia bacterium]
MNRGGNAMNTVSKNIRRLRKRDGLTQDALAEKLHVTRQAVSNWETGRTQPDIDMLSEIADAFGADIAEVIYGEPRRQEQSPEENKRKLVTAGILGFVTLVLLLLALFLAPVLKEQAERTFCGRAYFLWLLLGLPLLYLFAAMFLMSVFSVFWDFRIKHPVFRRVLLVLSAGLFLIYWIPFALGMTVFVNRSMGGLFGAIYFFGWRYLVGVPALFLLPGIGLYLGMKKLR